MLTCTNSNMSNHLGPHTTCALSVHFPISIIVRKAVERLDGCTYTAGLLAVQRVWKTVLTHSCWELQGIRVILYCLCQVMQRIQ